MSRGYGVVQRHVLNQVREHPDKVIPLYAMAPDSPALRSSLRRAVERLEREGLVHLWTLYLPTPQHRARRAVLCVSSPEITEVTNRQWREASWVMVPPSENVQRVIAALEDPAE